MLGALRLAVAMMAGAAVASLSTGSAWAGEGAAPPDETALRYYAAQGQKDRVAAEARRLSQIYPDWHSPADLYAARPGRAGEEPLWSLFAEDKIDDLHRAILVRQRAEPGWQPSADLVTKIDQRILRTDIMRRAKQADWPGIAERANASGIAWAAGDPEVLWVIARAYAGQNDFAAALLAYRAILEGPAGANARGATIENAIAAVPFIYVEKLLALARLDAGGHSEFESLSLDITRGRLSAIIKDEAVQQVPAADLAAFQAYAKTTSDANQPGLVAWFYFKRGDASQALDWFKFSMAHGGDAMIAHGLALTLRKLGLNREAEEVAFAWREPLINNAMLFIDILGEELTQNRPRSVEAMRLARYAQVVTSTGSGEGAQALGWYAYNTCQYPAALEWFSRAVAWKPKEATVLGYALTLQRLKRAKEFRDIVNRYDGLFPKVVALAFDEGGNGGTPVCDGNAVNASNSAGGAGSAATPMAESTMASANIRVPSPDFRGMAAGAPVRGLARTTDFPVAVSAGNPLRFSALHNVVSEDQSTQGLQKAPRVARRVLGAGPMPYERFGYSLMPAWDGTTGASSPAAGEKPPAAGTFAALALSLQQSTADPRGQAASNIDFEAGRLQRQGHPL